MRKDYQKYTLLEENTPLHPIDLFQKWYEEALEQGVEEAYAFNLSTLSIDKFPESRIVLMRSYDTDGFVFYTNYESSKGQSIAQHPQVGMNFFWQSLERQVRIQGKAVKVPEAVSEAYFQSRPRESQIGAWASAQSSVLEGRATLEETYQLFEEQLQGQDVPRPPYWGGYCIQPQRIEFWQGRPSRLHDRIVYVLEDGIWRKRRLAP